MKRIRIIALIALAISLIVFMDLTYNYFNATFVEIHDGIVLSGFLSRIVYGDSNWALISFFEGFIISLRVVVILGITNIVLACKTISVKRDSIPLKKAISKS